MYFDPEQLPFESLSVRDDVLRQRAADTSESAHAFVNHSADVQNILQTRYGRSNLALKILPLGNPTQRPGATGWGKEVPLGMTSLIQNLFALRDLAPRVYGLVRINDEYAAQVIEFLPEGRQEPRVVEAERVIKELGVKTKHKNFDLDAHNNWRSGKFVDFSGWYLPKERLDELVDRTRNEAMSEGGPTAKRYQQVAALGLPGSRPGARGLPSAVTKLLPGSDVLDVGSNRGNMLRKAVDAGARRVVGIEKDAPLAELSQMINVLLGYWTIDVISAKLPQDLATLPSLDFDFIICLSTIKYIGDLAALVWLATLAPNLWLEGHGGISAGYYESSLASAYEEVLRLPDATDLMARVQFLCTNEGGRV